MPNETKSVMDATFARVYEAEAERVTGPISHAALQMVGNIGPGVRLLDIAAGTGALSVPAAEMGRKFSRQRSPALTGAIAVGRKGL